MKFTVISLFPEFFESPLRSGLLGKALQGGRLEVRFINPRDFAGDAHQTVDDAPYGGGPGMVMKPEPLVRSIRAAESGPVVMLTPQGRPLAQADLRAFADEPHLSLVSGRYEGFDERVRRYVSDEVSIGDYVLTGGEYGALAIIDGVARLLPGVLGNAESPRDDSFTEGRLEYPHYTRPAVFEGLEVPEVLRSGDHARIAAWRRFQSLQRTAVRRPDLFERLHLTEADRKTLEQANCEKTLDQNDS